MDDLRRLITTLVNVLDTGQPGRAWASIQVSELYQSILPYRSYKRELGFETNQDYEMALLRLLAGEGGYASVEPPEVQDQLAVEAGSVNPNPGLFREFAAARLRLNPEAVRRITRSPETYAPPTEPPHPSPAAGQPAATKDTSRIAPVFEAVEHPDRPASPAVEQTLTECFRCGEPLPARSDVAFCPYCGGRVKTIRCAQCGADIEAGWRFCAVCGTSIG